MILQWGLILSVTLVSTTMLLIFGAYLATLAEAEEYYSVSRGWVILLFSSFNIAHIVLTPIIFNTFRKYYINGVVISTIATGIATVGRYYAAQDYNICLFMTSIVAIAHIPIISAPYGLLKLFPESQKGYAASIPLFLPVLGINFCILYSIGYILDDGSHSISIHQVHTQISNLNGIMAIVGVISTITTVPLVLILRDKIEKEDQPKQVHSPQKKIKELEDVSAVSTEMETDNQGLSKPVQAQEDDSMAAMCRTFLSQKRTAAIVIAWGSIVGINWTYGSLFGIIFDSQNLTGRENALIGLAANLSTAIFSNLGAFIKNKYNLDNMVVIKWLNIFGIVAAVLVQLSRFYSILQDLYILIILIIVLRAGFSSFVSLAFVEMEKEGMNSLVISGYFFWIANVVNLVSMELIDLAPTDLTLLLLTLSVCICLYIVQKNHIKVYPI